MIPAKRNQLSIVGNKYQTEAKRVLVVCSAGLLRSPTGANVLHQSFGYNTRAAGSSEEYKAFIEIEEATSNSCSSQIAIACTLNKEDVPVKPVVDKDDPSTWPVFKVGTR